MATVALGACTHEGVRSSASDPTAGVEASADESRPPPTPAPCAPNIAAPTMETGSFCGPIPVTGNGFGPDGACTGAEPAPPCGAGVEIGRYYAFTVPLTCDGLVIFDGRRWYSQAPPPPQAVGGPALPVWMRLSDAKSARFIGPSGSVGFDLATGQPTVCPGG
jgi:hypothetical protein